MRDAFNDKMIEGINAIMDITDDCLDFGCELEDTLPATSYVEIEAEGKTYLVKIEVTFVRVE